MYTIARGGPAAFADPRLSDSVAPRREGLKAPDQRAQQFQWRVARARGELMDAVGELSAEITRANHSNERPDTHCFRHLVAKLMENSSAAQALEVLELQLAYGSEPPTAGDYATLATVLVHTGSKRLATELVSRVAHPPADFPVAQDDPRETDESALDILCRMQVLVGAYREALETITRDEDALERAQVRAIRYGSDLPAWRVICVSAWRLAQQMPEGARRLELLDMSAAALRKQSRMGQAQSLFDMGRVDDALQLLADMLRDSCEQDRFAWWALPFRTSVRLSARLCEIYGSAVWADFARLTGSYNPAHEALDRATVQVPFDLPGIAAQRRNSVLCVRELDTGARVDHGTNEMLASPSPQGVNN
ncbi:MAG: hypothetical protein V4669_07540 [Pseudomonadota bacterium]